MNKSKADISWTSIDMGQGLKCLLWPSEEMKFRTNADHSLLAFYGCSWWVWGHSQGILWDSNPSLSLLQCGYGSLKSSREELEEQRTVGDPPSYENRKRLRGSKEKEWGFFTLEAEIIVSPAPNSLKTESSFPTFPWLLRLLERGGIPWLMVTPQIPAAPHVTSQGLFSYEDMSVLRFSFHFILTYFNWHICKDLVSKPCVLLVSGGVGLWIYGTPFLQFVAIE